VICAFGHVQVDSPAGESSDHVRTEFLASPVQGEVGFAKQKPEGLSRQWCLYFSRNEMVRQNGIKKGD